MDPKEKVYTGLLTEDSPDSSHLEEVVEETEEDKEKEEDNGPTN